MTIKAAFFGAALAALAVAPADAYISMVQITISGAGDPTTVLVVPASPVPTYHYTYYYDYPFVGYFALGPITAITNGSPVTDTYYFFSEGAGGGLADAEGYYSLSGVQPWSWGMGIPIYTGTEARPTFFLAGPDFWGPVFYNLNSGNYDTISIVRAPSIPSAPEPATWVMLLAGFAALRAAARRGKATTVAPETECRPVSA
jgi:hypothetical protein